MGKSICPVCGGAYKDPEESYSLKDGSICRKCADDLRFRYPMIYIPQYHKLDDLAVLPGCAALLQKDLRLLRDSMRKITGFRGSSAYTADYEVDRMRLLTLEEFQARLVSADASEDRIRAEYMDYNNVLTVDYARPLERKVGREGIQNIRRKQSGFCVAGYIRAGAFHDGDMVGILHENRIRYADVLALDYEYRTINTDGLDQRTMAAEKLGDLGDQGHSIRAGYQVTMVLNEKADGICAGDWIVAD